MPLAAAVVLFVFAPLMGAVIERVLMRRLRGAPIVVTLTVTLGLLLFLIGLATIIWNPTVARTVKPFFAGHQVSLHVIVVTWHQLTVVFVALVVAVGLRVFLFGTRPGIATRAVVDDPDLAGMAGANPYRFGQLGVGPRGHASRPGGHPPGSARHPRHPESDLPRHQRLRRRDARAAEEPAPDLRGRPRTRLGRGLRRRLSAVGIVHIPDPARRAHDLPVRSAGGAAP